MNIFTLLNLVSNLKTIAADLYGVKSSWCRCYELYHQKWSMKWYGLRLGV